MDPDLVLARGSGQPDHTTARSSAAARRRVGGRQLLVLFVPVDERLAPCELVHELSLQLMEVGLHIAKPAFQSHVVQPFPKLHLYADDLPNVPIHLPATRGRATGAPTGRTARPSRRPPTIPTRNPSVLDPYGGLLLLSNCNILVPR